jgi:hypothetical protein
VIPLNGDVGDWNALGATPCPVNAAVLTNAKVAAADSGDTRWVMTDPFIVIIVE